MLYKLYESKDGNLDIIEKIIQKEGKFKTRKYSGYHLRHNVKNLHLIGLYRMYKSAMKQNMRPCNGWQTFSSKYMLKIQRFTVDWLKVLFRVAVYDDAKNL